MHRSPAEQPRGARSSFNFSLPRRQAIVRGCQALSFAWLAGISALVSIAHPATTVAAECPSTFGQPIPVGTGAVDLRTGIGRDLLIGLPDGVVRLDRGTGQLGDEIPLAGPAHLMVAGHGFIWAVDGINQRIQRISVRG